MTIRRAAVAGMFYPAEPGDLRRAVGEYLAAASVSPAPERVLAVIAPHAGYVYSGPTAGHAFARVRGKKPRRVVLVGRSHRYHFDGASVYETGAFETPLGTLPVDTAFAGELARLLGSETGEPHLLEHGLEVELPFLIEAVGLTPIVPVLFGSDPGGWHIEAGEQLARLLDEDDLVVVSTDLSHYLSEEEANRIDHHSLERVLCKDCKGLAAEARAGTCALCGATAVVVGMACALARGAVEWQLLDYRTSGHASGDYTRVVGYGAVSMERAA